MFEKLLIANRGEIACRVIKTAKRLNIPTVAIYSDADEDSLFVQLADEAHWVGSSLPQESYLNQTKIVEIAKKTGATAIHPGYGFLSENAEFAKRCEENNLIFVGPKSDSIALMGDKAAAKRSVSAAKVPLLPGYHGDNQDPEFLKQEANQIGYPVLIKASAGGGGKGMRVVKQPEEFLHTLDTCKREAQNSFGKDTVILEKYLMHPRHIEVQVFGDSHGNAVHLFERDCSIQRRHQKVIEEAPALGISENTRKQLGTVAVNAVQAIGYVNAGTLEFLVDENEQFYFMEMNTRLQVEHGVTEMITGLDLVEWQLRVANGEPLPLTQSQIDLHGHAIEVRVYAEDPEHDFLPTSGTLEGLLLPDLQSPGIRLDTGIQQGSSVGIHYDPMMAKLMAWGDNRTVALERLMHALDQFFIAGVTNNLPYLRTLIHHNAFQLGKLDTGFIEKHTQHLITKNEISCAVLAAATMAIVIERKRTAQHSDPWQAVTHWRLNQPTFEKMTLRSQGHSFSVYYCQQTNCFIDAKNNTVSVIAHALDNRFIHVTLDGTTHTAWTVIHDHRIYLSLNGKDYVFDFGNTLQVDDLSIAEGHLVAHMPGVLTQVLVKVGDKITQGDKLLVIEAMKMAHTITAPQDGIVSAIYYSAGQTMEEGAELLELTQTT